MANAAPALNYSLGSYTFDSEASVSSYYVVPPDPNAAVGPAHVLSVGNALIRWTTKDGYGLNEQRLGRNGSGSAAGSFFEPLLNVNTAAPIPFDPKAFYDGYAGRFVVVALEEDSVNATSRILLAVSQTSDPNDGWFFAAINSKVSIGGVDTWADYPQIAIDEEAVYISLNMKPFTGSSNNTRLWIVHKDGFYNGAALVSSGAIDVYGRLGLGSLAHLCPARVFGAGGAGPTTGTYFVHFDYSKTGGENSLRVIEVQNPIGAYLFYDRGTVKLGVISDNVWTPPDAPQMGSSQLIDTFYEIVTDLVYRNNHIYGVMPVGRLGHTYAHWFDIDATLLNGGTITLASTAHGNVSGDGSVLPASAFTWNPSVGVDRGLGLGICFSASASTVYAGAYYTGRRSDDPAGTLQSPSALSAGADFYFRQIGDTSRNRWGDFSSICIDPSNDSTFWPFNEWAMVRGSSGLGIGDGRYATGIGSFTFFTPGGLDPTFQSNPGANSGVEALGIQGDGKIILGGYFTTYNGVPRIGLARILADGTVDTTFQANLDNAVHAIDLQADGKILVGGEFTTVGGVSQTYLARLNSSGSLDTSFVPPALGGAVYAIRLAADSANAGKIYVGGNFTSAAPFICRLSSGGAIDSSFAPAAPNSTVRCISALESGALYFGGDFTSMGGSSANHIAKVTSTGAFYTGFGGSFSGTVRTILSIDSATVVVGGSFPGFIGSYTDAPYIWQNFSFPTLNFAVYTLARLSNGKILTAGTFTTANSVAVGRFVLLNSDGTVDTTFNPGSGASAAVFSSAVDPAGNILVGGSFATVNGSARKCVARVYGD